MKRLLDYDPLTGKKTFHYYDPMDDRTYIETVQDVEPYLKKAAQLRQLYGNSKEGIKNSWWHYAIIPDNVAVELKQKYNIDIHSPEYRHDKKAQRKLFRLMNTEYKKYKTTELMHNLK